ncbi:MAG: biosynthetic peptidoglycan transglycosylase, partial [Oscillospiraceae bacterium]
MEEKDFFRDIDSLINRIKNDDNEGNGAKNDALAPIDTENENTETTYARQEESENSQSGAWQSDDISQLLSFTDGGDSEVSRTTDGIREDSSPSDSSDIADNNQENMQTDNYAAEFGVVPTPEPVSDASFTMEFSQPEIEEYMNKAQNSADSADREPEEKLDRVDAFFKKLNSNGDVGLDGDKGSDVFERDGAASAKTGLFAGLFAKLGIKTKKKQKANGNGGDGGGDGTSNKKTKKKSHLKQTIGKIALTCACAVVVLMCVLSVCAAVYLVGATKEDYKILDLNSIKLSFATVLLAEDKETGEWNEYERIFGGENRVWVNYTDMPQTLIDALISSEDQHFRTHHGVDWKRTIAAFVNAYVPGFKGKFFDANQGGSTITQQLIKNITEENKAEGSAGALRKLREIYRALVMENNYSKDQILEAY